jgi:hypothetical protein
MKPSRKAKKLLEQIAAIERMERGKLCPIPGKNRYNLQAWHNGRNEVRYIREEERSAVEEAVAGYRLFKTLADAYADEIIRQTRREHGKRFPKQPKARSRNKRPK